jgi:ATP-dependent Clp protease adapter protein ClpS
MSSRPPHRRTPSDPPASGPCRRFNVVLHRATDKGLIFVVRVLRELTRFGEAEAESRMWEAYHRGRALVLVTHFERAELYVEQFADRGLTASIEPAA